MRFRYDPEAPGRPYEQIRDQVISGVAAGTLIPGDRLPAIRQLAEDLGLAPGTVSRAVGELERDGYVETRGRHGTYVLDPEGKDLAGQRSELEELASAYASGARSLGVASTAALREVERALTTVYDRR